MILGSHMKFNLGWLIITTATLQTLTLDEICLALDRHILGQWGDLSDHDRAANELALSTGSRLLSVYHTGSGMEFRVLTTGDRFTTTMYLSTELV